MSDPAIRDAPETRPLTAFAVELEPAAANKTWEPPAAAAFFGGGGNSVVVAKRQRNPVCVSALPKRKRTALGGQLHRREG